MDFIWHESEKIKKNKFLKMELNMDWKNYRLNKYPMIAQLLILGGTVLLSLVVFQGFGFLILGAKYGMNNLMEAMQHPLENMQYMNAIKWLQLIYSIGAFGLSAVLVAGLKRPNPLDYLQAKKNINLEMLFYGIVLMTICTPLISTTYYYNQLLHFGSLDKFFRNMELEEADLTKAFLNVHNWKGLLFNVFIIGLVAAVVEEFLFRGVLQNMLNENFKNIHVSIFITAALFSAIHMQFLGFIPRMLMGVVLGYMYAYSGNIYTNIVAHFFNNASQVVMSYFFYNKMTDIDMDKIDAPNWVATIGSAILLVALMVWMKKRSVEKSANTISNQ